MCNGFLLTAWNTTQGERNKLRMKFITKKQKHNEYIEKSQPSCVVRLKKNAKGIAKWTFRKEMV